MAAQSITHLPCAKQVMADSGVVKFYFYRNIGQWLRMKVRSLGCENLWTAFHNDTYPTPLRSAPSLRGPDAGFPPMAVQNRFDIEYQAGLTLDMRVGRPDFESTKKHIEGRTRCKNLLTFWPQWPWSALPAVLKVTSSAALQAQVQVWSQLNCWAQIQPVQRLLVLQSASCATTLASTPADNTTLRTDLVRLNYVDRRAGMPRAAIFCLGDGK